jgi:CubicO group peptidase (beta-lactamase class C family)
MRSTIGCAALGVLLIAQQTQAAPVAEAALQPFVERGEIAGVVVMVVDRNGVLEYESLGYADLAARRPMPKDAVFWLASTYKPFVGTAVMMLVDEGRIDLDSPVSRYLPGFDPPVGSFDAQGQLTATHPATRPVTVRMLLTHSAGTNAFARVAREAPPPPTLEEMADAYAKAPLFFEPGSRFSYSNASIDTAARIVEVASGMRFGAFLRTRLLEPLGMDETSFCLPAERGSRRPVAYSLPENGTALVPAPTESYDYALSGACDEGHAFPTMFSTAPDLARFAQMLLEGGTLDGKRYLSQASIEAMTRNQLPEEVRQTVPLSAPPERMGYGLGWGTMLDGSYFHPGTGMTDPRIDPTHRIATILLMQSTAPKSFEARAALLAASDAEYAPVDANAE